jgi:hypothetical protein
VKRRIRASRRGKAASSRSIWILDMKFLVAEEGNLSGTDVRRAKASKRMLFM